MPALTSIKTDAIERLGDELRFAGPDTLRRHVLRIEELASLIEEDGLYPEDSLLGLAVERAEDYWALSLRAPTFVNLWQTKQANVRRADCQLGSSPSCSNCSHRKRPASPSFRFCCSMAHGRRSKTTPKRYWTYWSKRYR